MADEVRAIICAACGEMASSANPTCPHCGRWIVRKPAPVSILVWIGLTMMAVSTLVFGGVHYAGLGQPVSAARHFWETALLCVCSFGLLLVEVGVIITLINKKSAA